MRKTLFSFNPLSAIRVNIFDGKFDLLSVLDPYDDT